VANRRTTVQSIGHFPQISPPTSVSFAGNSLELMAHFLRMSPALIGSFAENTWKMW